MKRVDCVLKVLAYVISEMVWMLKIINDIVPSSLEIVLPVPIFFFSPAPILIIFLSLLFFRLLLLFLFKLSEFLLEFLHLLLVIVAVGLHDNSVQVLHIKCIKVIIYEYLVHTLIESVDNVLTQSGSHQISRVVKQF